MRKVSTPATVCCAAAADGHARSMSAATAAPVETRAEIVTSVLRFLDLIGADRAARSGGRARHGDIQSVPGVAAFHFREAGRRVGHDRSAVDRETQVRTFPGKVF